MRCFLWCWNGTCFGYRCVDSVFSLDGIEAGRFCRFDIFGANGKYLGEIRQTNRLITKLSKKCLFHDGFDPSITAQHELCADLEGLELPAGYVDFPSARSFRALHEHAWQSQQGGSVLQKQPESKIGEATEDLALSIRQPLLKRSAIF